MKRSRRVAISVAAVTGLIGGAGAAVANAQDQVPTSPVAQDTTARAVEVDPRTAQNGALADYVTTLSAQAGVLDQKLSAAQQRLAHAKDVRARKIARAKARAAAEARARVAQAQAAQTQAAQARTRPVVVAAPRTTTHSRTAPASHTSTGASGASAGGDDSGEGRHDG